MKMTECEVRRRLRDGLQAAGCLSFIAEMICTGFPDLLLSHTTGNYLIELKVSEGPRQSLKRWLSLFEPIQLYQLCRLRHAYGLIYVDNRAATLCRVKMAVDKLLYEIEIVAEITSPIHLLETLASL